MQTCKTLNPFALFSEKYTQLSCQISTLASNFFVVSQKSMFCRRLTISSSSLRPTRPLFLNGDLGAGTKTEQSNVSFQLAKISHPPILSSLEFIYIVANWESNLSSRMLNKQGAWDAGHYVHHLGPWISAISPKWWKFAQITLILLTWFDKNFSCIKDFWEVLLTI